MKNLIVPSDLKDYKTTIHCNNFFKLLRIKLRYYNFLKWLRIQLRYYDSLKQLRTQITLSVQIDKILLNIKSRLIIAANLGGKLLEIINEKFILNNF